MTRVDYIKMQKIGKTKRKILLALLGGVSLGMSSSPRQYFNTFRKIRKEWEKIDGSNFNRSIMALSREKLIEEKVLPDGSFRLVLTVKGKKQASRLNISERSIDFRRPSKWDWKWRLVIFDIPEKDRDFRNILRNHLRELKFHKLQNSVFVPPHPFEDVILELVQLYAASPYVRVVTAEKIDNGDILKKRFMKTIRPA